MNEKAEPNVSDELTEASGTPAASAATVAPAAPAGGSSPEGAPAASTASEAEGAGSPEAAPKPRRRGRKPKAEAAPVEEGAAENGQAAPPEAAATGDGAEAPKPARRTRTRRAAKKEAPAEELPLEVAQARALAQVPQADVARLEAEAAERAAQVVEGAGSAPSADGPGATAPEQEAASATVPEQEAAPKPRRRGRKPKAAAEAPAAEVAERVADLPEPPASGQPAAAGQAAAPEQAAASAAAPEQADKQPEKQAGQGPRRTHQSRKGDGGKQNHGAEHAAGQGGGQGGRNGGRNNRQQNNRNNRNNRNVPTEPTLTREELQACKVAELRERAKEYDIDGTGVKKAELVERIYNAAAYAEGFRDIEGILDITNEGFGYIRAHGYMPSRDDAFVAANMIRAAGLRTGDLITGTLRPSRANDKFPGLAKIYTVNGVDPEEVRRRPKFAELTPIYPNEPLKMEHGKDSITGRAIDIVSPIGKGQRGLIVSPPKAGKTTILKKICQSIAINNPEVHLICLLVDERPEEVTDMQRSIKGDVVASTFDMPAENHTKVSELVIERAKRIVEMGGDVVVVLDSITRLARAYNLAAPASGRILSGGVDSAALYPPKRFLGAARNIENGGSLTIIASALVDTGSKMDEVIFEEFKGTGNMELKLDRDLADKRIFPAIDPVASGTRNEDLLIDEQMRPFIWGIRRILANMNNTERCAASFIKGLKSTNSNQEFLIRTARKAADHPDAL